MARSKANRGTKEKREMDVLFVVIRDTAQMNVLNLVKQIKSPRMKLHGLRKAMAMMFHSNSNNIASHEIAPVSHTTATV